MKDLLIISAFVPYKSVGHAGGKTHYYYLKKYSDAFNVRLITFAENSELEKAKNDLNQLNISYSIIERKATKKEKLLNLESTYSPFNRNCRMVSNTDQSDVLKKIKELKENRYSPDIVVLEWTQMLLACRKIKKYFPNAKIVASEHDVSFLSFERKYLNSNGLKRIVHRIEYKSLYSKELKALKSIDLILTQNEKDKGLLIKNGINDSVIHVIVPYYSHLKSSGKRNKSNNLLFFGAMYRPENYQSAIWFIENVFSKLHGFIFVILGGNPHPVLEKYKSEKIKVTGFVDDIQPYFDEALCFVSPLVSGAGIKVKVLEAFTSGIPVLTNLIGIEGIPAKDGHDYIHCEKPEDYVSSILELANDLSKCETIGNNGKEFIEHCFDMESSAIELINKINYL